MSRGKRYRAPKGAARIRTSVYRSIEADDAFRRAMALKAARIVVAETRPDSS